MREYRVKEGDIEKMRVFLSKETNNNKKKEENGDNKHK